MAQSKKTQALATTGEQALDVMPDFLKDVQDSSGLEHIRKQDLRMPRLAVAQGLSPELKRGDPKYIADLEFGMMFNNITGQVYGKDTVEVVVVKVNPVRWVLFDPKDRHVILDRNVPDGDPRTQWGSGEDGKPAATQFLEFVAMLYPSREPIALSFKGTGIKAGQLLVTLLALKAQQDGGKKPSYAYRIALTPGTEKNPKGEYAVLNPRFAGYTDQETFLLAKDFYASVKDQQLEVETVDADVAPVKDVADEDVPF
jgi:hypothetical protein